MSHGTRELEEAGLRPVDPFAERTYRAIAVYAFDEAECWPKQERIAGDVGCRRESVNRAVQRLREAGWLRIRKHRLDGHRWRHNVYELLAPYAVSPLAAKRITRRAHRRLALRQKCGLSRHDHMNRGVGAGSCSCRSCRPDRPWRRQPAPPLPGSTSDRAQLRLMTARLLGEVPEPGGV